METKFKAGDKFIPHRPEDTTQYPRWDKAMDNLFNGTTLTFSGYNVSGNVMAEESECYTFHPDWCEKVETPAKPSDAIYDLTLEYPIYNHIKASNLSPQPQTRAVTIDWEQRRYELAKSAMQGLIVTGWNIYEAPNLVGKSIEISNEMIKQLKQQLTTE